MWGCLAKVKIPKPKRVKNGPKTVDCIFIGYAENSSAYRFLVHDSKIPEIHKDTIMESRDATFFENVFPRKSVNESGSKRTREDSQAVNEDDQDHQTESESESESEVEVEPRRSKRARTEKSFGSDFLTYLVEGDPRTYKEAVSSADSPLWKEAIKSEIDSIMQNHTWELVDLPPGCKPLTSKWIFKKKLKSDKSIDKYKARPVIRKEGVDYFDTYSPDENNIHLDGTCNCYFAES